MPKSVGRVRFCRSCEAKGIATRVPAGQMQCAQCRAEGLEVPGAPRERYVSPVEEMRVKAQGEQKFQAWVYAVVYAVGAAGLVEYSTLRLLPAWDTPGSTYLTVGSIAAVIGAIVGYFVGLGRPPWRDDV